MRPRPREEQRVRFVLADATAENAPTEIVEKSLVAFREGVQRELRRLAKKKVATATIINGKVVRAVPRKMKGRYVVGAVRGRP